MKFAVHSGNSWGAVHDVGARVGTSIRTFLDIPSKVESILKIVVN